MATNWYLSITDGVTSCVFADGAGGATVYILVESGWSPKIAGIRRSALGGRTAYEDVVEDFDIVVSGATVQAVLTNFIALVGLLEQAERWGRGEPVAPVLMKFSPKGGTISTAANPLQAVVLGRAGGDSYSGLQLPVEYDRLTYNAYIVRAKLRLLRRGLWLANTEDNVAVAATANGDLITFTMPGTLVVESPTRLTATNFMFGKTNVNRAHGGFLIVGQAQPGATPNPIFIYNPETGLTGPNLSSVADAGANARNTNVLRYTPATTNEYQSSASFTATLPDATDLVAVYANIRPSATVDFRIRILSEQPFFSFTPSVLIPANATLYPKWYFLGMLPGGATQSMRLALTASAASSFLDIDTIVVCDARSTQVLALIGPSDADPSTQLSTGLLSVDHKLLLKPAPSVLEGTIPVPYSGDPVFATRTTTVYAVLLATGGGTFVDGNQWRQADIGGGVLLTNAWNIYRRTAHLVPQ